MYLFVRNNFPIISMYYTIQYIQIHCEVFGTSYWLIGFQAIQRYLHFTLFGKGSLSDSCGLNEVAYDMIFEPNPRLIAYNSIEVESWAGELPGSSSLHKTNNLAPLILWDSWLLSSEFETSSKCNSDINVNGDGLKRRCVVFFVSGYLCIFDKKKTFSTRFDPLVLLRP